MRQKHFTIFIAMILAMILAIAGCGPDISAPGNSAATEPPAETSAAPAATENPPTATEEPPPTESLETLPTNEAPKDAGTAEAGYNVGNALPDFSVPLMDGGTFTLSENLGRPVFINLFATWCPPCVGEMPEINQLCDELGDQVAFVAIDIGEDEATAKGFADSNGYTLPFAYSEDGMPFGSDYPIGSIPQTFVLDASGVIIAYFPNAVDYDTFKLAIQAALAQ